MFVKKLKYLLILGAITIAGNAHALNLRLPFGNGEDYYITIGYGGSTTHQGNDYYALDFAQNGCSAWNDPVLAVESGTVEQIRTGQPHQTHTPSYGNYVRIRHADGSKSLYAHLNQVNVQTGWTVSKGHQIGTVGNSGYAFSDSCSSHPGTHLHFVMYNANGSAKKPEPMSTHTGFSTGQWYQAPAPVYRFWSNNYQRHFYTISKSERDHIIAHDHNWAYEGIAFEAFKDGDNVYSESPVYRLWRNNPPGHFYTISSYERNAVLASGGWVDEGEAYRAFTWQKAGSKPLYRFWNGSTQSHFYTASQSERDYLIAHSNDWSYEGIGYYILN